MRLPLQLLSPLRQPTGESVAALISTPAQQASTIYATPLVAAADAVSTAAGPTIPLSTGESEPSATLDEMIEHCNMLLVGDDPVTMLFNGASPTASNSPLACGAPSAASSDASLMETDFAAIPVAPIGRGRGQSGGQHVHAQGSCMVVQTRPYARARMPLTTFCCCDLAARSM